MTQLALKSSDSRYNCLACLDTRLELKCISFCTPARGAINNRLESFPVIRFTISQDELQSLQNCYDTFGTQTASYFQSVLSRGFHKMSVPALHKPLTLNGINYLRSLYLFNSLIGSFNSLCCLTFSYVYFR